jgi:hypothetical protein
MSYIYRGNIARSDLTRFELLTDGDYTFEVLQCDEPYFKNDKWIMKVKLSVGDTEHWVYASPWSGTDRTGTERDGIGEFFLCINRVPRSGTEPSYEGAIGARGRCRIKQETVSAGVRVGEKRNAVAFFHLPKQVGLTAEAPRQSYSQEEYNEARRQQEAKSAGPDDLEPTDIPF